MVRKVLIVGQGLAGSVLALELLKRGCEVHVVDDQRPGSASPVAAGMFNPMSFRRIIPVWRADEVMPAMETFYRNAEQKLGSTFFHRVPLVKVFPNGEYAALWKQRMEEGLPWITDGPQLPPEAKAPHGCGMVPEAGYLDLPVFMRSVAELLAAEGRIHRHAFNEDLLEAQGEGFVYRDAASGLRLPADAVVLATGTYARGSKLLGALPLQTNKGEVLTVRTRFRSENTLNNGKWLLPIGEGAYRLGSSYLPGAEDAHPTGQVAEHLLEKAALMVNATFEVEEHRAGLRPTVSDRRPLLGESARAGVYHFNGLGTRGVLNAPLLAELLAEHLLHGRALDREVSVNRFVS